MPSTRCSCFGIADVAAGLAPGPARFAAVVFAVLPMQAESVAWITGRVDSMPACFYLASFLFFAAWRAGGTRSLYAGSVVCCFVALFSKQNTMTLPAALVLYDAIVVRRPLRAVVELASALCAIRAAHAATWPCGTCCSARLPAREP